MCCCCPPGWSANGINQLVPDASHGASGKDPKVIILCFASVLMKETIAEAWFAMHCTAYQQVQEAALVYARNFWFEATSTNTFASLEAVSERLGLISNRSQLLSASTGSQYNLMLKTIRRLDDYRS